MIANTNIPQLRKYTASSYFCFTLGIIMLIMYTVTYCFMSSAYLHHQIYTQIGFGIMLLIMLVNASGMLSELFRSKIILVYFICVLFALLFYFVNTEVFYQDLWYFSLSFVSLIAGMGLRVNPKFQRWMFAIYFTISGLILLYILKNNLGGSLEIRDEYVVYGKNGICALLATQVAVAIFYLVRSKKNFISFLIWGGIIALLVVGILFARGRAALIALVCVSSFVVMASFGRITVGKVLFLIFSMMVLFVIVVVCLEYFSSLASFIGDSFAYGRDVTDLEDLSSGRWHGYISGVQNFFEYPLTGATLTSGINLTHIHNYPIRILASYGLIFGLPYFAMWLTLVFITAKKNVPG